MELIDKRIKEEFKKSDLPIPDDFDQMVYEKIAEGLEKSENDKIISIQRRTKRLVASIVFVVTCSLFVGITGKANINYLKERLESLGAKDKKEIVDQADEASVPAAIFTREFSESEYERMELLRYKYESEGMYPEKELQIVNSEDEVDEDTICFYPKLCKYYLPERELTDEELLEYIDYGYKLDYALKERSDKEDEELDIEICSDDELKSLAMDKLTTCFGVDEKNLSVNIDLHNFYVGYDGDYERTADVNVYDEKNHDFYRVDMEAVTGTVRGIYKNNGIMENYGVEDHAENSMVEYDIQECQNKYEQLKSVAELYGGKIDNGCFYVFVRGRSMVDNVVMLCYQMENGNYIEVDYCLYDNEVESIEEINKEAFDNVLDWWREDADEDGYEIKKMDM